jgi:hypothetical protein
MPAKEMNHRGTNTEIEYVVSGRESALHKQGKDNDLQCVRNDGQHHGGSKARTRQDRDGVVSHGNDNP